MYVNEFDDLGVGQAVVHGYFIFSDFVNLDHAHVTTFIATMFPVWRSFASLTWPYEPKPIVT